MGVQHPTSTSVSKTDHAVCSLFVRSPQEDDGRRTEVIRATRGVHFAATTQEDQRVPHLLHEDATAIPLRIAGDPLNRPQCRRERHPRKHRNTSDPASVRWPRWLHHPRDRLHERPAIANAARARARADEGRRWRIPHRPSATGKDAFIRTRSAPQGDRSTSTPRPPLLRCRPRWPGEAPASSAHPLDLQAPPAPLLRSPPGQGESTSLRSRASQAPRALEAPALHSGHPRTHARPHHLLLRL